MTLQPKFSGRNEVQLKVKYASQVTTSIYALLLAACGGGGGGRTSAPSSENPQGAQNTDINYRGRVFDGPIVGADVYLDVDKDGTKSAGDYFLGKTDDNGNYAANGPAEYDDRPILVEMVPGAYDKDAPDTPLRGLWRAPAGSTIVSPLTDIILSHGFSLVELNTALGLPEDFPLLTFDAFAPEADTAIADKVADAGARVATYLRTNPNASKQQLANQLAEPATPSEKKAKETVKTETQPGAKVEPKIKTKVEPKVEAKSETETTEPSEAVTGASGASQPQQTVRQEIAIDIYENHPLNKAIYDAEGDGKFTLGGADKKHFRVDEDGKVWWNKLANYEKPKDQGKDNNYEIKVTHEADDGTVSVTELSIDVGDIQRELKLKTQNKFDPIYIYNYQSGPNKVKEHIPDDHPYTHYLLDGHAFYMPKTGSLEITWSIYTEQSPDEADYAVSDDKLESFRANFERAFAAYEKFINVKFIEVPDTQNSVGMLRVGNHPNYNNGAATPPDDFNHGVARINIANISLDDYAIYLHEIGHILGLAHPYPGGGDGIGPHLDDEVLSLNSIMTKSDLVVFTQNDINALQFLYGAPGTNFDGLEQYFETPPEVY